MSFSPSQKTWSMKILNTAVCDNSDEQYIKLDGSTCKNFGLLNTNELNRRIHHRYSNSRKNKVDSARMVSADIQKKGIFPVGNELTGFTKNEYKMKVIILTEKQ